MLGELVVPLWLASVLLLLSGISLICLFSPATLDASPGTMGSDAMSLVSQWKIATTDMTTQLYWPPQQWCCHPYVLSSLLCCWCSGKLLGVAENSVRTVDTRLFSALEEWKFHVLHVFNVFNNCFSSKELGVIWVWFQITSYTGSWLGKMFLAVIVEDIFIMTTC